MKGRWCYDLKWAEDGSKLVINKFKARYVCCGYSQIYGMDYDETFSPTAKFKTFRTLLSLMVNRGGWTARQFDVSTAFLHAPPDCELYVEQPPGHVVKGKEDWVWKLNKTLYGTKQGSRNWSRKLTQTLLGIGFTQAKADECLFMHKRGKERIYVVVHVDDMAVIASKFSLQSWLLRKLNERWEN